ncbi:hypothetical protein CPJCM30710_16700 [Clostridium polyendosporum]|uniref:Uncharacterized protein n=1 Tax=Clostridium polyendosporum TaxID=69208 RepID=A0A919RZA3_9CLOT|nr:hypothetical protein [Clostridium polyendosporum]GIM29004.1 hypothetical protein CPJCM30710_16700 [Clostridium polyendosporum]
MGESIFNFINESIKEFKQLGSDIKKELNEFKQQSFEDSEEQDELQEQNSKILDNNVEDVKTNSNQYEETGAIESIVEEINSTKLKQAIIYSEIINKPVCRRKRRILRR